MKRGNERRPARSPRPAFYSTRPGMVETESRSGWMGPSQLRTQSVHNPGVQVGFGEPDRVEEVAWRVTPAIHLYQSFTQRMINPLAVTVEGRFSWCVTRSLGFVSSRMRKPAKGNMCRGAIECAKERLGSDGPVFSPRPR
jgi:hypothetical protein